VVEISTFLRGRDGYWGHFTFGHLDGKTFQMAYLMEGQWFVGIRHPTASPAPGEEAEDARKQKTKEETRGQTPWWEEE
jgi:hypothetical protein